MFEDERAMASTRRTRVSYGFAVWLGTTLPTPESCCQSSPTRVQKRLIRLRFTQYCLRNEGYTYRSGLVGQLLTMIVTLAEPVSGTASVSSALTVITWAPFVSVEVFREKL
jgi:hypothetical protein